MADHDRRPKVGVAVFVRRKLPQDGLPNASSTTLLMMLRRGSHGAGTWSVPGGLVEADEGVAEAAARELAEETGIVVSACDVRVLAAPANLTFFHRPEGRQGYVTLYAFADVPPETLAKIVEPDKCGGMEWVHGRTWPGPLFPCVRDLMRTVLDRGDWGGPAELLEWLSTAIGE